VITALGLGIKYKIWGYWDIYGIWDQNFSKKWAQGSKLSKNSGIIKTKIYHVKSLKLVTESVMM